MPIENKLKKYYIKMVRIRGERVTLLQQKQKHQSRLQHHPILLETGWKGLTISQWYWNKLIIHTSKDTVQHQMIEGWRKLTWFTTLSVTPVLSCPLLGAIESNSSKNRRHGAAKAALENISRTWSKIIHVIRPRGFFIYIIDPRSTSCLDASKIE